MDLAKESGVPQPSISGIERGVRKRATHHNIKLIAKALDVSLDELEEDDPEEPSGWNRREEVGEESES